jgi:hypothetical protein
MAGFDAPTLAGIDRPLTVMSEVKTAVVRGLLNTVSHVFGKRLA